MTSRYCKYLCGTLLEGFDEEERKYKEAETGYLHTQDRCEKAKKDKSEKATQTETSKQNEEKIKNGNASKGQYVANNPLQTGTAQQGYVDHTAKGNSQVVIFVSSDEQILEEAYNVWLKDNKGKIKTQGAQYQMCSHGDDLKFSIALYYEEVEQ